jgi:NitT/TauT family transport system substrate-binding protein
MNILRNAFLLLVSATCAGVHAQARVESPVPVAKRIVLLVDEVKAIRNFPVVVAERLGYLRADGMDVTIMNTRDDPSHADMLMDGRVDAVMAYFHHNIVNHSEGRASEAIVTLGLTPGAKVLVANQAKDRYKTAADLKGSRILSGGAGSSKTTVANALVLAGGHRLGDYTRLPTYGQEKNLAALRDGSADLVVAPVPEGDYYEAQGAATVFADLTTVSGTRTHLGTTFPSSTVFMATERVQSNPEIARHLATAFVRTLRYINTHSAEEIAALIPANVTGKDKAAYLKLLKQELPMFAGDGRMPADGAEKEWRVLSEFNPKLAAVALDRTYTNEFVEEALKRADQEAVASRKEPR